MSDVLFSVTFGCLKAKTLVGQRELLKMQKHRDSGLSDLLSGYTLLGHAPAVLLCSMLEDTRQSTPNERKRERHCWSVT